MLYILFEAEDDEYAMCNIYKLASNQDSEILLTLSNSCKWSHCNVHLDIEWANETLCQRAPSGLAGEEETESRLGPQSQLPR